MRKTIEETLRFGAQGIKVMVAGRLNGAEIARTEWYLQGRLPLHTLRADIDYGFAEAHTTFGVIGVKVLDLPRRDSRPEGVDGARHADRPDQRAARRARRRATPAPRPRAATARADATRGRGRGPGGGRAPAAAARPRRRR